jgi:hypothetical protein
LADMVTTELTNLLETVATMWQFFIFYTQALKYARNFLGKRNIAKKTLIDGRFLI